jgi:sugar/nucleoside kinase (ribokinase family)
MYKGIFLGLATVDIIYYVPSHLKKNSKLKAVEQLGFAGGPATNAAIAFTALGSKGKLITGLGNHPLASLARSDLHLHGVKLIDCANESENPPIISSILVDITNGDRSVVYSNTDTREINQSLRPDEILHDCSVLMLDGYFLDQAIEFAKGAKEKGIPVVLDGGSWKEDLDNLLPHVDYALCSNNFFSPGCTCPIQVIEKLLHYGAREVCITRGNKPILFWDGTIINEIDITPVEVVDTLGAGDIFHGAFCHFILSFSYEDALARSAQVAGQSCKYRGTREWIRYLLSEKNETESPPF